MFVVRASARPWGERHSLAEASTTNHLATLRLLQADNHSQLEAIPATCYSRLTFDPQIFIMSCLQVYTGYDYGKIRIDPALAGFSPKRPGRM
jgi:hypothetical protein